MTDSATTTASDLSVPQCLQTLTGQLLFWRLGYCSLGAGLGTAVGTGLGALLFSGSLGVSAFTPLWLLPGVVIGCVLVGAGWHYAGLRFSHYQAQHHPESGVCLYDGVWWRTETWVPIARLQHLDVSQGPLDRRWGMAKLSLHTAGTHEQVLDIKGLPIAQAQALRAALLPHLHHRHD